MDHLWPECLCSCLLRGRKKSMTVLKPPFLLILSVLLLLTACTKPAVRQQGPDAITGLPGDRAVLAGEWEYEEGAVTVLKLDEQGNGAYMWKEGRFETTELTGHTWHGVWFQRENDREGGFTVELSPDFSEGEGRWWYTRIGQDNAPTQKGGTFHLTRKDPSTALSQTPAYQ